MVGFMTYPMEVLLDKHSIMVNNSEGGATGPHTDFDWFRGFGSDLSPGRQLWFRAPTPGATTLIVIGCCEDEEIGCVCYN